MLGVRHFLGMMAFLGDLMGLNMGHMFFMVSLHLKVGFNGLKPWTWMLNTLLFGKIIIP